MGEKEKDERRGRRKGINEEKGGGKEKGGRKGEGVRTKEGRKERIINFLLSYIEERKRKR